MPIPCIENLRSERWATLSFRQRLEALQELENRLAEQERREACIVALIPEDKRIVGENGETILRGQYIPSNDGSDVIQLDSNLVLSGQPYEAVEVFFHEARHAYQAYAIRHPEVHNNPEELQDWQKNFNGGYIEGEGSNYALYRWQPIEADANKVARERTDELYSAIFQDTVKYPVHKSEKEQEFLDDIIYAKGLLGSDYQQKARQAMIDKYLEQQKNLFKAHAEGLLEEGMAVGDSLSEGEGEDYGYGYGY